MLWKRARLPRRESCSTAQVVPTEDIHPKGFAYLVPELFNLNRGVRLMRFTYRGCLDRPLCEGYGGEVVMA